MGLTFTSDYLYLSLLFPFSALRYQHIRKGLNLTPTQSDIMKNIHDAYPYTHMAELTEWVKYN